MYVRSISTDDRKLRDDARERFCSSYQILISSTLNSFSVALRGGRGGETIATILERIAFDCCYPYAILYTSGIETRDP